MRIAFVGKGGSGKTTMSALFSRHLAADGAPVLAIDGDINQHLAEALAPAGGTPVMPPPLGPRLHDIKAYLRGANPRITSTESMIKTTPPGRGSRLLSLLGDDELHARHVCRVGGVPLMATGEFDDSDLGVACYHSKLGAVELYLGHLIDGPGEYVVVDMTAGADAFASGLFTRFDLTLLVAEPTRKGVSVYHQYRHHAREFGIRVAVVGNKVTCEDDLLFLKEQVGDDLLTHLVHSDWVRAAEQGRPQPTAPAASGSPAASDPLSGLEPHNRHALTVMRGAVDSHLRDWDRLHRHAVEFHLRNARSWADARTGEDLAAQVDPEYVPGPPTLPF
ncbi:MULTISPECIES: ATP-binding protein [unclassified Streptomyces]|uniref:ATP-binding protein n=1 Tax=unclassified Streptomyces TaxID=2593676 RepID=UPI0005AB4AC8|nr:MULTISPECIES: ATP-binding protein [unclassified Streptomyces]ODA69407.1 CobQ/CobB/MinD/ParA nucleotide binding domain protein [Streptomyces sp. AVP053U2]